MEMVTLTINGQTVQAPKNSTILEAARSAGIYIPTLCYHPELAPEGACRLCVVEASGARNLVASCVYPVAEGMVVKTNTPKVRAARRMVVELLLANHPKDCLPTILKTACPARKAATANCKKLPPTSACAKSALKAARVKPIPLTAATRALYATRKNASSAAAASAFAAMYRA